VLDFQKINLVVRLDVDNEYKGQVDKLISLSERYCVVLQTLQSGVTVETKLGHVGKEQRDARGECRVGRFGRVWEGRTAGMNLFYRTKKCCN
jgi:hypothetical protein